MVLDTEHLAISTPSQKTPPYVKPSSQQLKKKDGYFSVAYLLASFTTPTGLITWYSSLEDTSNQHLGLFPDSHSVLEIQAHKPAQKK